MCTRVEMRSKLNLLEMNIHAETFYKDLFNIIFGYNLLNLNEIKQNARAIDLIDRNKKVIIQVSSTANKNKISKSLSGIDPEYKNYNYKFIAIKVDASKLKGSSYNIPISIHFDPKNDIYDITTILRSIQSSDIETLKKIDTYLDAQFPNNIAQERIPSNIVSIIEVLSEAYLNPDNYQISEIASFEVQAKIDFNKLDEVSDLIKEFSVFSTVIDQKYSEFDKSGINRSNSVLSRIRSEYLNCTNTTTADERFMSVTNNISEFVSQNWKKTDIPREELDLCVQIIVVDAFIRCKIFRNPNLA